jgi:hypothetical protein
VAAEAEHGHRDEGVGGFEAEGDAGEEPDRGVDRFGVPVRMLSAAADGPGTSRGGCMRVADVRDDDPSWQPLSALPMLTVIAAEGVRLAREPLNNLREAHPYRLDDALVARVISTWEVTQDDLTSCSRNRAAGGNSRHAVAGGRSGALVAEERGLVEDILALLHELPAVTIERLRGV